VTASSNDPPISRRYLQLDVFADRPGAGNPLGVVFDAADMDGATMQAYAQWANLSETVFFLPPTQPGADYRVRIFTPRQELPFAGHPSVGAAWAALDAGLVQARDGALVQECGAGLLPVRVETRQGRRVVHVRSPRARRVVPERPCPSALFAATAGLPPGPLEPALWNNGPDWWLVPLADEASVRQMTPDLAAIAMLTSSTGAVGLAAFARADHDACHDVVVRAYCPADGIPEDPVTGSANASIGAMLHEAGLLPGSGGRYVASQGRELGRDGRVEVRVDEGEVWIGGQVQAVIRGTVDW
jgi:PhzF family phenazine biosynthesis protein